MNDEFLAGRRVPYLHAFVIACRGNTFAIGGPCHGVYCIAMTAIDEHLCPSCSVPYLYRAIVACRGYTSAIGRPCHGLYSIPMASIGNDAKSVSGIPYTYRSIKAGCSDVCTSG